MHTQALRYYLAVCIALVTLALVIVPSTAMAQNECTGNDPYGIECTANQTNLKTSSSGDLNKLIATIIKTILGLTGVIFMIMIVTAGDLWMTANGNEEKLGKARSMIFNAAIGIIIVFGAYIATNFIVTVAIDAIGG